MNWNHILIEGYCARLWKYHSKNSKWVYCYVPDIESFKTEKEPNPRYDPNVKKPQRPKYCKKHICINCIKCKYLAISSVEDELKRRFDKMYNDYCGEAEDED
jgi:hypothetical protein